MPSGRVVTLEDEKLFLPDPVVPDAESSELNHIGGLSVRMTEAMNRVRVRF